MKRAPMTRNEAVLLAAYLTIALCRQVTHDLRNIWRAISN